MATEQLYREDVYKKDFTAKVLSCTQEGKNYIIELDRTCFYPEGGGQPGDKGTLNGISVLDTKIKDGVIRHTAVSPIAEGTVITGKIDFDYRFNNMQHHTAEHIISGIIKNNFDFDNCGFGINDIGARVDITGELTKEQLDFVEDTVNKAVHENIEVVTSYPDSEELKTINYRSKKELTGKISIVTIGNYDCCACCGTHVARTGEIGAVKIVNAQNYKGGMRFFVLAGNKAMLDYRNKTESVCEISRMLSTKQENVTNAVKKVMADEEVLKQKLISAQQKYFAYLSKDILKQPGNIIHFEDNMDITDLRRLCDLLSSKTDRLCAVLCGNDADGYKYSIGCKAVNLRPAIAELNKELNGRGGGDQHLVQGTFNASKEAIISTLSNLYSI